MNTAPVPGSKVRKITGDQGPVSQKVLDLAKFLTKSWT